MHVHAHAGRRKAQESAESGFLNRTSIGHAHSHARVDEDADRRRLVAALVLLGGFMLVEVVVGVVVHSLALLADAGHMLADTGALALALFALWLARRPAAGNLTFGFRRAEILSAQANGLTLFVLGLLVVVEGIRRLIEPPDPGGLAIVVVALSGMAVNLLATWQLAHANRESMNVRGAYLHVLTDLYAFAGTAVAGVVILTTGFARADGIAALAIAGTMFWASYGLLRDSGRVFLEAAPEGLDVNEIGGALASHPSVASVHDLHVWEISSDLPSLSAHVLVRHDADCHQARHDLEGILRSRFGLEHTTLQVEHEQGLLEVTR
jgi:cobalt-zinc-cadmium efflux system protein